MSPRNIGRFDRFPGADSPGDLLAAGSDWAGARATGPCQTMPLLLGQVGGNQTPPSGTITGCLAIARRPFTATQIRMSVGTTFVFTGAVQDFRMCVWDPVSKALLKDTGDVHGALVGLGANALFTQPLTSGLAIEEGQAVMIGPAAFATTSITGALKGVSVNATTNALTTPSGFKHSLNQTGYTGGAVPALGAGSGTLVYWADLIP